MKMKNRGFTHVDLMIFIAIIGIVALLVVEGVLNNKGVTQKRAYDSLNDYIEASAITVERRTCAGDSDLDGYGSCTVVTTKGEKIQLQCETSWFNTQVVGATGCKEVDLRFESKAHTRI